MVKVIFKRILITIPIILSAIWAFGTVYGTDDRKERYEVTDERILEATKSVAAVFTTRIYKKDRKSLRIWEDTVDGKEVWMARPTKASTPIYGSNLCKDERFADQPAPSSGTAFLVGKKHVLTAAHVIFRDGEKAHPFFDDPIKCSQALFVFDFVTELKDGKEVTNLTFSKENVYKCAKVVARKLDFLNGNVFMPSIDYALVELDREVTGDRKPFIMSETTPAIGTEIFVVGHPMGLSQKIADNAKVVGFMENRSRFKNDADVHGGNSGSPVINLLTGEVEGIHVSGDIDLKSNGKCQRFAQADDALQPLTKSDKEGWSSQAVQLPQDVLEMIKRLQ